MNTGTSSVKVVVIYPRPTDEEEFERAYKEDHIPMVEEKLQGMTRLVTTKVLDSPQGKVAAYRLTEVHFSSMDDLSKCLQSDAGKEVVDHAIKISTGGAPILLICEEQSYVFW
jgi:uncharacterized protein (TIGR02118 family)